MKTLFKNKIAFNRQFNLKTFIMGCKAKKVNILREGVNSKGIINLQNTIRSSYNNTTSLQQLS